MEFSSIIVNFQIKILFDLKTFCPTCVAQCIQVKQADFMSEATLSKEKYRLTGFPYPNLHFVMLLFSKYNRVKMFKKFKDFT